MRRPSAPAVSAARRQGVAFAAGLAAAAVTALAAPAAGAAADASYIFAPAVSGYPGDVGLTSVAVGPTSACAISREGEIHCAGSDEDKVTAPPEGRRWKSVSVGQDHACGVTIKGEGLCWGRPSSLTEVPTSEKETPYVWRTISAGTENTCGLTVDGQGFCWGSTSTDLPTSKESQHSWVSIEAGRNAACGVTAESEGFCWGKLGDGLAEVPSGHKWRSISPGERVICGLTTDYEAICWTDKGIEPEKSTPPDFKYWLSVDVTNLEGVEKACGITLDHKGYCWGSGSVAEGPSGYRWASLDFKNGGPCGVTDKGEVLCWPDGSSPKVSFSPKEFPPVGSGSVISPKVPVSLDISGAEGNSFGCRVNGVGWFSCESRFDVTAWMNLTLSEKEKAVSLSEEAQALSPLEEEKALSLAEQQRDPANLTEKRDPLSPETDGVNTVEVREKDKTSATGPTSLVTWVLDSQAPKAPEVSGPEVDPSARRVTLEFSGDDDATFRCRLDDGDWASCAPPMTFTGLSSGGHTVYVVQADAAGNESPQRSVEFEVQDHQNSPWGLETGSSSVRKGTVLKATEFEQEHSLLFQWQRCTGLNDQSSCAAITHEGGANGAWWGTRDADIGYQLRLKATWSTGDAYSVLSGLVRPLNSSAPTMDFGGTNAHPVRGRKVHSSFGVWGGYISGVTTVAFQWQRCSGGSDVSSCLNIPGATGQWYRPTASDTGNRLRVVSILTTRGQTATAASAISQPATAPTLGRRVAAHGAVMRHRSAKRAHKAKGAHKAKSGNLLKPA
ncbi:MAG: hypothetical protein WCJ63_07290 [Actinomycetes bacterium]